jgi:type II secretory pathway component PulF
MTVFTYKAREQTGATVNGLVEAPTDDVAARLLRDKNLFIISLTPKGEGLSFAALQKWFHQVKFSDIVNFTRQMATMSVAGLSLPESLSILRSQTKNQDLIDLYLDIEHNVVSGGSLANALAKHSKYFNPVYIALIKAGEASGALDRVLLRMADSLENQMEFRSRIKSAMIYPAIIVIGMLVVVFLMMTIVIPRLTELYKDFGVTLPFTTRLLIGISQFFVDFWWLILLFCGVLTVGISRGIKTPVGRLFIDTIILKTPLIGTIQSKVAIAEFSRTFGMLIGSGIHILDALSFLQSSTGNILFEQAIGEIGKKVEKGFALGDTIGQYEVFPIIVSQMIKVGEETGKLDDSLNKLAVYFEREADHLVKNLSTAIEPLIMVVLGLGVGFIVYAIITPIYSLTSSIK